MWLQCHEGGLGSWAVLELSLVLGVIYIDEIRVRK